jgi:TolB-like protein
LVVLPLENQSPDPDNAFFTDGMHSEIISVLQQRVDVRVISRASALEFKPTTPVREVEARLGVAYAISGNVRRGGGKVRIQLELRRTRDDALLWTQTYNRDVAEFISVQTEIAGEVARVLQARERRGWRASAQLMTKNPEALDLFLKADRHHIDSVQQAENAELARMLEQALQLDPEFMPAASLLSTIHTVQFRTVRDSEQRAFHAAEAKRWAERASQLVPGGAGDSSLAAYYFRIAGDPVRALALMDGVVRALPNDSAPLNRRAVALAVLGRVAESISDYTAALKLDPLSPLIHGNRLYALATLRRRAEFDRAVAEADRALPRGKRSRAIEGGRFMLVGELAPPEGLTAEEQAGLLDAAGRFGDLLTLARTELLAPNLTGADERAWRVREALALQRLRRFAEAENPARRALELAEMLKTEPEIEPGEKDRRLAQALALLGRPDEAIAAQRRAIETLSPERVAERWRAQIALARLCAQVGRARECVEMLAPLLRVPCGLTVPMLLRDAAWDRVRDDAGFKALLADPKNNVPL